MLKIGFAFLIYVLSFCFIGIKRHNIDELLLSTVLLSTPTIAKFVHLFFLIQGSTQLHTAIVVVFTILPEGILDPPTFSRKVMPVLSTVSGRKSRWVSRYTG